jgi:hypothetical protein
MATTDSPEAATKQSGCAFAKAAPSSTSNVDDNGDMEAGAYEAQEQDLPLKEITQYDEDDVTGTCIRDLAATKSCLGYHPDLKPPPATEAAVTCVQRGTWRRFTV